MEVLWKGTVSAYFRANRPKLCGNCSFPQNFHTRKLGEITVFFVVYNVNQCQLEQKLRFPPQNLIRGTGLKLQNVNIKLAFLTKNIGLLTTARGTLITSLTFYKAVISLMIRIISELLLCSVSCSMSHQKELLIL